jgi:hypothetical protein
VDRAVGSWLCSGHGALWLLAKKRRGNH